MRIVLDTNVLISGTLYGGHPRAIIDRVLLGEFQLIISPHLLDEFDRLLRSKFSAAPPTVSAIRSELEALAEVVIPDTVPNICRDPDDDHVLAAAVAGSVDAIVTGDKDLLVLDPFEGIAIIRPAELL